MQAPCANGLRPITHSYDDYDNPQRKVNIICSHEGCDAPRYAKSFCRKHWDRFRKHGDPSVIKSRGRNKYEGKCVAKWCRHRASSGRYCSVHLSRRHRFGSENVKPTGQSYLFGMRAQRSVANSLRVAGRETVSRSYSDHTDLIVDGWSVEVKGARFHDGIAQVNFHRHGKLEESGVDFYVVRVEGLEGFKYAIHLLVKAPVNRLALTLSLRSILTRHGQSFADWFAFRRGDFGRKGVSSEVAA